MGANGPGWAGSLALSPLYKHKCPLTGTTKSEAHRFSEMPQKRSGKEKPKAEDFHEEKAISFLCST